MKTEDSKIQEVEQPKITKKESVEDIGKTTPKTPEEADKDIKDANKDITDVYDIPQDTIANSQKKTLNNTTASQAKENVSDIEFWGDGDTFKLISKASSKSQRWMKSTKAHEIAGLGCLVQVTTQQGDNIAEAVTFVPGASLHERIEDGNVVARFLVYDKSRIQ